MTDPAKRPKRPQMILEFLANNPGEWRCYEIAAAIGEATQPTANECARLARAERVDRIGSEDPRRPTFYRSIS